MSEPIRVLHILQRMEAGGTQALLMSIYRKIDRTKVQFDFLVEYPDEQFYDQEIKNLGGRIYYTNVRNDFNIPKFCKQLRQIFEENPRYRIVHVHTYSIGYFCLKTAQKAGVPVRIAHSHNNETVHDSKYAFKLIMQKLYTLHATDLFACSDEAGKYLFKNEPFQVLPNAIDSDKFIADDEVRKKIRMEFDLDDKLVIGHVGRFHPQKNHDFLIDIFSEIKKKRADAELLLVGTGPLEDEIKKKVSDIGLDECVHFLGNRKDMNRIYQAMDVFVFPSAFEGLGIVSIEAQAAGVPVVCSTGLPPETNITPIYQQLAIDNGAEKWADTVIEIAQSPMAHTNLQKYVVNAGFDVNVTAKTMENYYLNKYVRQ